MSGDKRDVLQVLRYELNFLEQGGYDRLADVPEASPFLNSRTCLNFEKALRTHACQECLLYDFVPAANRLEDIPCHYIQLTEEGDTISKLLQEGDHARLRSELCDWLRNTIRQLELEPANG